MTSWGESYNSVRWIKRTQYSFSESFFSIFILGYFPFRHNPLSACNITLQIPQEQSQWMASWRESCNCVRWINSSQISFSESFFSVFILGYFLFHHSPLLFSKYHFANSTRTVLAKGLLRGNCSSVRSIHRTQRSFSESFFHTFSGGYFLWTYSLQRDPK